MRRRPVLVRLAAVASAWIACAAACAETGPPCPSAPAAAHGSTRVLAAHVGPQSSHAQATAKPSDIAVAYRETAYKILAEARGKRDAYEKLRELTDGIGHRLSGSASLERAIVWAQKRLAADGHKNVRTEKVMVPHWERGAESADILAPVPSAISILGLGGTVGTPAGGVEGEVLVVRSFEELDRAGDTVRGKIVLFDVSMRPHDHERGSGYGDVVGFRASGPSRAAKLGAKAALVRSLATASLDSPHTGATRFDDGVAEIPSAAVSVEASALIARLAERGEKVRVRLRLGARHKPDAPSANVLGELVGRERPDEIVLIGAHIDSWDVGQGAHDDGAGCVIMMQALTTLRKLGLRPRRTIRVVLFTNEENGLAGARAYAKDHAAELGNHILGVEADAGGFAPFGFNLEVPGTDPKKDGTAEDKERQEQALARLRDIAALLAPLGQLKVTPHFSGADLIPLVKAGVPGIGYVTRGDRYFDLHHSAADTLDKVDPNELADGVAAVAVLAYVAADLPDRW